MTSRPSIFLGSFIVGEVPPPLVYQFLDVAGTPINLIGYGVIRFQWGEDDHGNVVNPMIANGTLADALTGQVVYTWTGVEFATTGPHAGLFFVNNVTRQIASLLITWQVCASVGAPPIV